MNLYWIITVFVLFLLKPLFSFAEGSDPFDNTIVTFDDNIQTSDPLQPGASLANQEISSQSDATVALDQPINTRYSITRYSMQGLIKSANKTQMMFVAVDENIKFLLSLKDCLGLDCGYVTDIDKRGRVTIEDEKGIYRFQVGYAPFIVENKVADMSEETLEVLDEDKQRNEETAVTDQESDYVINLEDEIAVLDIDNLNLKSEIQVLSDSNSVLNDDISSLNKQIQELNTTVQNLQDTITSLNFELEKKSKTLNDAENKIAIQEKQISTLKNDLDSILSKSSTANSDKIQELQNTIATQEQTLSQQQENIDQLKEELKNNAANTDTTASSENVGTQNLQDTITSLNFELEKKSKTLNDAENKIAIQEKQISTLKNDLDSMLNDINEKLNAKQELINNLKSQLLMAQSTTEPSSSQEQNEQSTDSSTTKSTEITPDTNDLKGDNLMVARDDVNIREKPSPNSTIIGVLLKDNAVNVEDTEQGWYKVILKEGKEGYIYSPMLKEKN